MEGAEADARRSLLAEGLAGPRALPSWGPRILALGEAADRGAHGPGSRLVGR